MGLWNYPVPEQALEMGLLAVCGAAWAASRKAQGRTAWPAIALIAALVTLQIVAMLTPLSPDPVQFGGSALAVYLVVIALAALTDLRAKQARAG